LFPRGKEIKNAKLLQEIMLNNTLAVFCHECKHEVIIRSDEKVHCLPCLMKGHVIDLQPKPNNVNRKRNPRKNSKVKTYSILDNINDTIKD
jgi:hypothetical protein